ncbi:hypothetical protein [Parasitella parasitica]|uniref:acetyl-CoA C-acetyltransferase n=1 Tax=Parasitella parasitica TaxID=35722 RepID=A0A0B7N595_9FUNG|nr:hypothetical protein [Parasitella parasitica]
MVLPRESLLKSAPLSTALLVISQDDYAIDTCRRAQTAYVLGLYKEEIASVADNSGRGQPSHNVEQDGDMLKLNQDKLRAVTLLLYDCGIWALHDVSCVPKAGPMPEDIEFYEINKEFSVFACINSRLLKLDKDPVNIWDATVGMSHPQGSSGCHNHCHTNFCLEARGG